MQKWSTREVADRGQWMVMDHSLSERELNPNGVLDGTQVRRRQGAELLDQTRFVRRGQLIRHRLALGLPDADPGLAGIEPGGITAQRNHLHPVQKAVGGVVADDDGGAAFSG